MIEVQNLVKHYGSLLAVDRLNFTVPDGEIFGFLGPNGAGKTTTVKMLCGLLTPDLGSVKICGYNLAANVSEAKALIGFVPDEPYIYPKLTAWEFLQLVAGVYQLESGWQERAREYLDIFELSDTVARRSLIEGFSHGMKQKVVFASVLMRDPKVLLLDEPLVGLDPKSMRYVKELLRQKAQSGVSIFLSTHVLSVADELADRMGIIQKGQIQFMGTKSELTTYLQSRNLEPHESDSLEDLFLKATG